MILVKLRTSIDHAASQRSFRSRPFIFNPRGSLLTRWWRGSSFAHCRDMPPAPSTSELVALVFVARGASALGPSPGDTPILFVSFRLETTISLQAFKHPEIQLGKPITFAFFKISGDVRAEDPLILIL